MREALHRPGLVAASMMTACLTVAIPLTAAAQTSALTFEIEGLDLETGAVIDLTDPAVDPGAADVQVAYHADRGIRAVVQQADGAEIALMPDTPFEYVSASDVSSVVFTTDRVDESCDGGDTVLIRTTGGSVFKLGNFLEDATVVVFDYELLQAPGAAVPAVRPGGEIRVASRRRATAATSRIASSVSAHRGIRSLGVQGWQLITDYIERDLYRVEWRSGSAAAPILVAANAAQAYTTRFGGNGPMLHADGTGVEFGLELTHWGYAGAPHPAPPARLVAYGPRVEYLRGSLTEWYINRASGLEQGFTLSASPPGDPSEGPLRLEMLVSGSLVSQAGDGSIYFSEPSGGTRLRYGGLVAWDATGRELPSRMTLAENRLTLEVDDLRAVYPVTIDPTIVNEDAKLVAGDRAGNDQFGIAVAVSGTTVVVGARLDDDSGTNSGSAYVFERPPGGWAGTLNQVAKLVASDAAPFDNFGDAVAVSGDIVVVGSVGDDDQGSLSGSAYVFVKHPGGWTGTLNETAKLLPSDGVAFDTFGDAVGVSGGTVVVRAPGDDDNALNSGSAYVFEEPVGGWAGTLNEAAKLLPSDGLSSDSSDANGQPIAVSGTTVALGAPGDDDQGADSGSVYIFEEPSVGWAGTLSESAKLLASDGQALIRFGNSVGISGDTVVAGAPLDDDQGFRSGSAYVFEKPLAGWAGTVNEVAKLLASDGEALVQLGVSVAVSGDRVVAGTPIDQDQGPRSGSAYIFEEPSGGWFGTLNETVKLLPSDGLAQDRFGVAVAVGNGTVVVGSRLDDGGAGSAYVFEVAPSNQPPVCAAVAAVSAECGGVTTVVAGLDGSASSDPDSDPLTFSWTTDCPGGTFDDASSATPILTVDSLSPGVCAPLTCGATLTVSDGNDSDACVASSVQVEDTTVPTISQNAGPATLECGVDSYTEPGATATDICDPDVPVTIGGDVVDPSTVGSYAVTYDGSDDCSNAAVQEIRNVLIQDTLAPAVTCPAGIPLVLDASCQAQVPDVVSLVSASDACSDTSSLTITQDLAPGLLVGPGSHAVTVTVTDGAGNSAQCQTLLTAAFEFDGFLPPIDGADATGGAFDDPVRSFKLKSTIPVKFGISCSGVAYTQGVHTLHAIHYTSSTNSDPPLDATPQDAATTGNEFRLTGDEWHYNLDAQATGMSKGQWQLVATLSDGTMHFVWIQVK